MCVSGGGENAADAFKLRGTIRGTRGRGYGTVIPDVSIYLGYHRESTAARRNRKERKRKPTDPSATSDLGVIAE